MTTAGGADDLYRKFTDPIYKRWGGTGTQGIGGDNRNNEGGGETQTKTNLIHALIEGLPAPAEPLCASHQQHLPPAAPLAQP